jgi:CNT family concentrative nucleoside transporter
MKYLFFLVLTFSFLNFYNSYALQDSIQQLDTLSLNASEVIHTSNSSDSLEQNSENQNIVPISQKIIPHQGISFESVGRGVLGMAVLLLIAFLFSINRKAINWRTIGIGIGLQIILAYGILEISWVQAVFDIVGSIFVQILNFTAAGSEFLLGGLMDTESYGYIFLFQVLPTIIFFSALTSILFYFGIIQVSNKKNIMVGST